MYIPYYNPRANRIAQFYPDFIFWLQKGNDYFIVLVDPKGTTHADYQHKIDWYRTLFENSDIPRTLTYGNLNTRVFAFLHTDDVAVVGEEYRRYWFDGVDKVLETVLRLSS